MKNLNVIPNVSVGEIKFGMPREVTREILGAEYKEFKKNKYSAHSLDAYQDFHVYFNDHGCEAIEFFGKDLFFRNKNLMQCTIAELQSLFDDLCEEDGFYISKKYSMGITTDDNTIEAILFGKKGYYID